MSKLIIYISEIIKSYALLGNMTENKDRIIIIWRVFTSPHRNWIKPEKKILIKILVVPKTASDAFAAPAI